jgi:pyruvate dehydrogenase E1 component
VRELRFHRPADASPEMRYLRSRRERLGGPLPARSAEAPAIPVPAAPAFAALLEGSQGREKSTTTAFVQILQQLLRDPKLGRHVVPIVADEARTFGMQSLFRQVGIYSSVGQLYAPEDHDELLYYKEAKDGQILEEGITEAGAMSSWIAAATSYSAHGVAMLPFYIFYSMFGFQRIGDLVWAAADSRSRGFLLGATAGRTTLAGEGLQHQDGTSPLAASTIPTCKAYDPCFQHELALIVQDGARRMLEAQEDCFYYVTLGNENYAHPAPKAEDAEGVLRGLYRVRPAATGGRAANVQLLASGPILREALAAAVRLEGEHGVGADVWSVTSWTELRWDGMRVERERLAGRSAEPAWIERCLGGSEGPIVAASDYVRAVPDLVRPYVPEGRRFVALGTDGFGRSDTRAALRGFFEVDAASIVAAALAVLGRPVPHRPSAPPWTR